ncbi:hypothetical protein ACOSP7_022965 [Xanthoceras sorbifolium]
MVGRRGNLVVLVLKITITKSNRANSKVGGSRFDVLGEVEDDTTKGSHGHSKLQTNDMLTYISNVKATGKVGINYKKKVKAA